MTGKILKITSNDLYGNVDDRRVVVFACFQDIKYMNSYVIFAFENEYGNKKLCYGSVHFKYNSLVIFMVREEIKQIVDQFVSEYMLGKVNNFKILNIDNMEKVELVSYNQMEYDSLYLLDEKSIYREVILEEEKIKRKKPIFLYIFLFLLILLAVGLTLLYFYPELFSFKYNSLECNNKIYDKELELYYDIDKVIKFDKNNRLDNIDVTRVYTFLDSSKYYDFKNNNMQYQYFNNGESFKFIDEALQLKLLYNEDSVIDEYEEMYVYMKKEGYSCKEVEYEE